jgi:hopene-associated glycosyltransferase HpnB
LFDPAVQILALASLAAWLYLLLARGGFWRADRVLDEAIPRLADWPPVIAVVPARNEAECVVRALRSLLDQDYPGALGVIVVDDNSTDGTGRLARRAFAGDDRLVVIDGAPLPAGWSGKMWAVNQGLERIAQVLDTARFVLLCDADIEHGEGNLRRLVGKAERDGLGLVSLMARLPAEGFWDGLLIPAFVFFFQKLYPFAWVADNARKTAGAAGGCMLVRRSVLAQIGGVGSIRRAIIDDCALAAAIKKHAPLWLGLSRSTRGLRPYGGLGDIWRMVTRTAFVQLNYSALLLAGTVLGMTALYLLPPAALIYGWASGSALLAFIGLAAWALMAGAYGPTLARYGRPFPFGLLLPLAAFLFTLMTLDAARRHWLGRPPGWKGRPNRAEPETGRK